MGALFIDQLNQLQATDMLAHQFRQVVYKPDRMLLYTKAYQFHAREAARYKALLAQATANFNADLDYHDMDWDDSHTEQAKSIL